MRYVSPTVLFVIAWMMIAPSHAVPDRVLGQTSRHSETLVAQMGYGLYALQLTDRHGRLCQARGFFRGAPPQAAQFCTGRVTEHYLRRASRLSVLLEGDVADRLGACVDADGRVIMLYVSAGEDRGHLSNDVTCPVDLEWGICPSGWEVQGVQLYFNHHRTWWRHARLIGARPLCAIPM